MADLRSLLKKGKDHNEAARELAKKLTKEYPLVAEILGGSKAKGTEEEISPGAITIYIHEGKAKFFASVKSAGTAFLGEVADLENPWGCINTALLVGDVSSKGYTGQKNGSPTVPDDVKLY